MISAFVDWLVALESLMSVSYAGSQVKLANLTSSAVFGFLQNLKGHLSSSLEPLLYSVSEG